MVTIAYDLAVIMATDPRCIFISSPFISKIFDSQILCGRRWNVSVTSSSRPLTSWIRIIRSSPSKAVFRQVTSTLPLTLHGHLAHVATNRGTSQAT